MNERAAGKPKRLTIGGLSTGAAVNIETVRYYERVGLLPTPRRTAGGHRLYGPEHVMRLTFVRLLRKSARYFGSPMRSSLRVPKCAWLQAVTWRMCARKLQISNEWSAPLAKPWLVVQAGIGRNVHCSKY
jgi:hypothetical protein